MPSQHQGQDATDLPGRGEGRDRTPVRRQLPQVGRTDRRDDATAHASAQRHARAKTVGSGKPAPATVSALCTQRQAWQFLLHRSVIITRRQRGRSSSPDRNCPTRPRGETGNYWGLISYTSHYPDAIAFLINEIAPKLIFPANISCYQLITSILCVHGTLVIKEPIRSSASTAPVPP